MAGLLRGFTGTAAGRLTEGNGGRERCSLTGDSDPPVFLPAPGGRPLWRPRRRDVLRSEGDVRPHPHPRGGTLSALPGGLSSAEVAERVAQGRTNVLRRRTSRSVWDILLANLFTWFNLVLGTLWVVILIYGEWRDALFGLVLISNTAIGVVQELRAKRTLDRLSLITAPSARVIRDGVPCEVATSAIVLDDVVLLSAGDQVVVDGVVLQATGFEVDESTLTGEADPEPKRAGDQVLSGSFVVSGQAICRATAVGADSWAARIENAGRRFVRTRSEIMRGINAVLKTIGLLMIPVGGLTVAMNLRASADLSASVTDTVAALVAMVPEGLVLLSSIAFAVSALTLTRRNVLVNELAAVETLARTDVVCADKTGTLTEREPTFTSFEPLHGEPADGLAALAALAAADPAPNGTMRAILESVPVPAGWTATACVPFSSARKWSAADFGEHGSWVLGAPDVLLEAIPADRGAAARARLAALVAEDRRVLLLARATQLPPDALPPALEPAGFALFAERLRPDAPDTVRYLRGQGIALRVISGDAAATVARVAEGSGVPGAERALDTRGLDDETLGDAVATTTVFGRVMPDQKSVMVAALQRSGHTVAMTGDGVNDVVALKQADLGIAMGSGVPAARAVAQVVLLDDRFASVPHLMAEGRRVVTNAEHVFLTKTVWATLLAVAVLALAMPYPLLPRQITLVGSLTIGIPAFFLALRPVGRRYRPGFVRRVLRFAIPAGTGAATAVIVIFQAHAHRGVAEARSLSTLVLLVVSLAVIILVEWPLTGWRLSVVGAMAVLGVLAFLLPVTRDFFQLRVESAEDAFLAVGVGLGASAVVGVAAWASRRAGGPPAGSLVPEEPLDHSEQLPRRDGRAPQGTEVEHADKDEDRRAGGAPR